MLHTPPTRFPRKLASMLSRCFSPQKQALHKKPRCRLGQRAVWVNSMLLFNFFILQAWKSRHLSTKKRKMFIQRQVAYYTAENLTQAWKCRPKITVKKVRQFWSTKDMNWNVPLGKKNKTTTTKLNVCIYIYNIYTDKTCWAMRYQCNLVILNVRWCENKRSEVILHHSWRFFQSSFKWELSEAWTVPKEL